VLCFGVLCMCRMRAGGSTSCGLATGAMQNGSLMSTRHQQRECVCAAAAACTQTRAELLTRCAACMLLAFTWKLECLTAGVHVHVLAVCSVGVLQAAEGPGAGAAQGTRQAGAQQRPQARRLLRAQQ
jgi:hypothetical protein